LGRFLSLRFEKARPRVPGRTIPRFSKQAPRLASWFRGGGTTERSGSRFAGAIAGKGEGQKKKNRGKTTGKKKIRKKGAPSRTFYGPDRVIGLGEFAEGPAREKRK